MANRVPETSPRMTIIDAATPVDLTIDGVALCIAHNSGIAVMLTCERGGIGPDGKIRSEHVIATRFRLNLKVATDLRDMLSAQIALLAPSRGEPKN